MSRLLFHKRFTPASTIDNISKRQTHTHALTPLPFQMIFPFSKDVHKYGCLQPLRGKSCRAKKSLQLAIRAATSIYIDLNCLVLTFNVPIVCVCQPKYLRRHVFLVFTTVFHIDNGFIRRTWSIELGFFGARSLAVTKQGHQERGKRINTCSCSYSDASTGLIAFDTFSTATVVDEVMLFHAIKKDFSTDVKCNRRKEQRFKKKGKLQSNEMRDNIFIKRKRINMFSISNIRTNKRK